MTLTLNEFVELLRSCTTEPGHFIEGFEPMWKREILKTRHFATLNGEKVFVK